MIPYSKISLSNADGAEERRTYYNGIVSLICRKSEEAKHIRDLFLSPENLSMNRESYRAKYLAMLGWPLDHAVHSFPSFRKRLVENTGALKIYRLCLETLPDLWFPGLLFEPQERDEKKSLVIVNPGGGYCVEDLIAHGDYKCEQYCNMAGRFLERGCTVYMPQFLLWKCDGMEPGTRQFLDARLKALGSSIAALEIFSVCRAIDYLVACEPINPDHIGIMGLSYGAFYALYISAAEPRIRTTFASCFFCNRFCSDTAAAGCKPDWLWQDSANTFFDAEVAALIAPRALFIENGINDEFFPINQSQAEFDRLKPFYHAAGADGLLAFHIGENDHRVSDGDKGFDFFLKNL